MQLLCSVRWQKRSFLEQPIWLEVPPNPFGAQRPVSEELTNIFSRTPGLWEDLNLLKGSDHEQSQRKEDSGPVLTKDDKVRKLIEIEVAVCNQITAFETWESKWVKKWSPDCWPEETNTCEAADFPRHLFGNPVNVVENHQFHAYLGFHIHYFAVLELSRQTRHAVKEFCPSGPDNDAGDNSFILHKSEEGAEQGEEVTIRRCHDRHQHHHPQYAANAICRAVPSALNFDLYGSSRVICVQHALIDILECYDVTSPHFAYIESTIQSFERDWGLAGGSKFIRKRREM